jgi:streptogramin lyase
MSSVRHVVTGRGFLGVVTRRAVTQNGAWRSESADGISRALGGLPGLVLAAAFEILPGAAAGQMVTEIALPVVGSAPIDIVAGSDESVWFTEQHGSRIGRIGRCGELATL